MFLCAGVIYLPQWSIIYILEKRDKVRGEREPETRRNGKRDIETAGGERDRQIKGGRERFRKGGREGLTWSKQQCEAR